MNHPPLSKRLTVCIFQDPVMEHSILPYVTVTLDVYQVYSHCVSHCVKNGSCSSSSIKWKSVNRLLGYLTISPNVRCYERHRSGQFYLSARQCILLDKRAPVITKLTRLQSTSNSWFTPALRAFTSTVRLAENLWKCTTRSAVDWSSFKSLCNKYHNLILSAKKHYYSNLVSSYSVNPKRFWQTVIKLECDGRPAEHRWRPLFNAAKFGWRPLLECRAVTLPRSETSWNLQGCPKLTKWSQPLVGRSSPYCEDM